MTRIATAVAAVMIATGLSGADGATAAAVQAQGTAVQSGQTPPAGVPPAQQSTPPAGRNQRPGRAGRGLGARGALPDPQLMGPGQIDQMFDVYMIYQSQPALNLTDEEWMAFGLKLRNLLTIRHGLQRQRLQALSALREMLKTQGTLDESAVTEKLRAYDELMLQSAPEIRQAYAAIDQVLKPRQRAQFRVFEEAMERRKLELIAMARQRQQSSTAPAPVKAPGPIKK